MVRSTHSTYHVPDDRVLAGASFGNASCWLTTKATGAIQKLFALSIGFDVFGSTTLTYGSPRHRLVVGLPPEERAAEERLQTPGGHVTLTQSEPGAFEFHRAYQRHRFALSHVRVVETLFVPLTGFEDPAVAYLMSEMHAANAPHANLALHAYAMLRGTTPPDVVAKYDAELGALIAWNESQPDWVRIFGCTERPDGFCTMHHAEDAYDSANVPALADDASERGDIVGALAVKLHIERGQSKALAFVHVFSERGERAARAVYKKALDVRATLQETETFYAKSVELSRVLTPDRTINDGAMWSKVNMLRVLGMYPQGMGFTNEPGESSNVVGRDVAWYTLGCDYLAPDVSKRVLLRYAKTQYASGKFPEYYNAISGKVEDYGLNINDDTPLFVYACAHHYQITGDLEFLDALWPKLKKACDYILAQRDERGLVICTATGEEVHGIAGWRNIIPNTAICGAVTEINAECYAALRQAARLAGALASGGPEKRHDYEAAAAHFAGQADALREAINRHLINPKNGMYVLNIGLDGDVHTDVTGDEVFPVMFEVAPPAVAYRVISRLNNPDFQTEAGLRTVSRLSPHYSPNQFVGLLGGVWPGLSFWYARAAAKTYPDAMVHNLQRSYAQYLRDPKIFNTVPGQFSEWFDGEALVNRGMRLSPWEPPRYLWAAVEGACGVSVRDGPAKFCLEPLMPSGWSWLAVRRIPLVGKELSFFITRAERGFTVFANGQFDVDGELEIAEADISDDVVRLNPETEIVAFRRGESYLICLGSTASVASTFPITIASLENEERVYQARLFDSTRREWITGESAPGKAFARIAMRLDAQGFGLIRLAPR